MNNSIKLNRQGCKKIEETRPYNRMSHCLLQELIIIIRGKMVVLIRKIPKIKDKDNNIPDLEKLDLEMEELKKKELEKVDEQFKYERKPKKDVEKKEDEIPTLKIGKGKIPKTEENLETVKLKGIPQKELPTVEDAEKRPKKEKPEDLKSPDTSTTEKNSVVSFRTL